MNRHQTVKVHNNEYLTDSLEDDVFGGRFLATLQRLVPWVFHGVYRWWNHGQYYVEPDRHSYLHRQKYTFKKEKPDEQKQKKGWHKIDYQTCWRTHSDGQTDGSTVPRQTNRRTWAALISPVLLSILSSCCFVFPWGIPLLSYLTQN